MAQSPPERLREICLSLPEAEEVPMRRGPSYRVEDRIFATDRLVDERHTVWCKVPHGSQQILIGADSERFFVPPYFGTKGWVGMRLDGDCDWNEVAAFVQRSYRLVAPKRLAASVP